VVGEACVGCGLCVHACLTEPASIRVRPRTQHSASDS
jgi:NAD-dependent dihydropyrimidine dehydrogenase PreA subunit